MLTQGPIKSGCKQFHWCQLKSRIHLHQSFISLALTLLAEMGKLQGNSANPSKTRRSRAEDQTLCTPLAPFLGSFPSTQATGPWNKDPAGAEQPYLLCLAEEPGRGHEVFSQQALWMVTC